MKVNQSDFSEKLAAMCGITASESKRLVDALKQLVYDELRQGNSVELSGFGQFSVSHRASRIGVNPRQPSEKITIRELNTPKFKAGQAFKEAIAIKN